VLSTDKASLLGMNLDGAVAQTTLTSASQPHDLDMSQSVLHGQRCTMNTTVQHPDPKHTTQLLPSAGKNACIGLAAYPDWLLLTLWTVNIPVQPRHDTIQMPTRHTAIAETAHHMSVANRPQRFEAALNIGKTSLHLPPKQFLRNSAQLQPQQARGQKTFPSTSICCRTLAAMADIISCLPAGLISFGFITMQASSS